MAMKMKSILSIILTVAVILGTVAAIPVSANAPTYSLPYLFTDFEDGYVNIFDGNYSAAHEIADIGYGDSSKSAKLTAADSVQNPSWQIGKGTPAYTASAGDVLEASFWVKLEKPWAANSVQLFVPNKVGASDSTTNTTVSPVVALDKTSTEWQKLTFRYVINSETTFTGWMELRMFSNALATVPEGETYGERVVYVDDFEMKIVAPVGLPYLFTNFEDGNVSFFDGNYSAPHEIADTGFGGSSKSAKLSAADSVQYPGWQLAKGISAFTASAGSMFEASFWIKLEKPWATDSIQLYIKADSDYNVSPVTPLDKTSTEWQKLTFRQAIKSQNTLTGWMELRMYNNKLAEIPEGGNYGDRVAYVDDFEMKILAPGVDRNYAYNAQEYDDYYVDFETGTNTHFVNYQSQPYGTVVAEPGNASNKVLAIAKSEAPTDGNAAFLAKNGNRTGIGTVNPGETVEISMDVKLPKRITTTLNLASNIKLFLVDKNIYSNAVDRNNTTGWQTLKMSYTNNTEAAFSGFTKFEMYFWQQLKADASFEDSEVIFYLDNIKSRIIKTGEVHPTIDNLSAARDRAGVLTAAYTYREAATVETTGRDVSYYKLIDADGAVVASGLVSYGIKIPAAYKNADLKLEIVPISSNKLVGESAVCTVTKAPRITTTTMVKDGTNVVVTAAADITDAKLIFVSYDENGRMLSCVTFDGDVTVADQETGTFAIPAAYQTGNVKIMLWKDMTTLVPLANVID